MNTLTTMTDDFIKIMFEAKTLAGLEKNVNIWKHAMNSVSEEDRERARKVYRECKNKLKVENETN